MIFREAKIDDIKGMQIVRNAVKENRLSDPNFVKDADYIEFLMTIGKGWVCEIDNIIVGFAIVDLKTNNVWALFLNPNFERKGIGQQLHNLMIDWYFSQTKVTIWLGTSPKTRASNFYKKAGWTEVGVNGPKEIKFEMTYDKWKELKSSPLTLPFLQNK